MKRFDDSTKKLIKNVAALATSALVLIAATIAWFASSARANTTGFESSITNKQYDVAYFKMKADHVTGDLMSATIGGSSPGFTFSPAKTIASKMADNDNANTVWEEAANFNIDSLEPGSFWSYRIHVGTSSVFRPMLVVNSLTWSGTVADADKDKVLKNVYVSAVVVKTGDTTYAAQSSKCCTLSDMLQSSGKLALWLADGTLEANVQGYDVLLDIGIPGGSVTTVSGDGQNQTSKTDNLRNAHDALRQIGVTFTLNQFKIE